MSRPRKETVRPIVETPKVDEAVEVIKAPQKREASKPKTVVVVPAPLVTSILHPFTGVAIVAGKGVEVEADGFIQSQLDAGKLQVVGEDGTD